MRWSFLVGLLLVLSVSGCGDSEDEEATAPSATASVPSPSPSAPAASPSPSASGSYVSRVNALCESMIPEVMAVRGDKDGDAGGDFPTLAEFEGQEAKLKPIITKFDAAVDAIPVTDADRAAADAFNAYREIGDAEAAKTLAAAKTGDQQKFREALEPSAEFEAKRRAVETLGMSCPAR